MSKLKKPIIGYTARELIGAVRRALEDESLSDRAAAAQALALVVIWEQGHPERAALAAQDETGNPNDRA